MMKWVIFNPDQFRFVGVFLIRIWSPEQLGQHKQGNPGVCSAEWGARDTWLRSKSAVFGSAFEPLGHPAVGRFGLCCRMSHLPADICEEVAPEWARGWQHSLLGGTLLGSPCPALLCFGGLMTPINPVSLLGGGVLWIFNCRGWKESESLVYI